MTINKRNFNYKNLIIESLEQNKTKLKLFNTLKQTNITNKNELTKLLILKIIHVLFLKNVLTSKAMNRVTKQCFKTFTIESKKNVNPELCDNTYCNTLFINSVYELLKTSQ
jgi:hypothetical protein